MAGALWAPDRRDIIWIDCNPQVGREMKDLHPMLVLSPKAFNERTGIVIGLPMTTAAYNDTNPFAIKFKGPKTSQLRAGPPAEVVRLARAGRESASVEARAGRCVRGGLRPVESDHRDWRLG